ncbi:MAG: tRNA 4-thiouridine(8) synthase ThiI [Endozoicomonadaceae bacterium]|nr:tRNA 4-thiouridine(8) synthase ThiI [Endozoicomonadaceae bacterium]
MKFIVKLFPEITIKSSSVRKRLTKLLCKNIGNICSQIDENIEVGNKWDHISVTTEHEDESIVAALTDKLSCISGICYFMQVLRFPLLDLDELLETVKAHYDAALTGKTFVVRVKRSGQHTFTSVEAEKYIGGGLNQQTQAAGVNLHHPDITINIEIKNEDYFLVLSRHEGIGGFPMGSQQPVLSLISGGFDSAVSSFMTMRRGIKTHFCFFNLGGHAHETGVKEVAYFLWEKYGALHPVLFTTLSFQPIIEQILTRVDPAYMGVILKRMMLKAATLVAREMKISTLSTGEAIAQVSSQTLPNLSVIDSATDLLTLRPLIVMDKQDIIRIARQTGTENFSKNMPEYCAVISKNPTIKANYKKALQEESKIDFSHLEEAVKQRKTESITNLVNLDSADLISKVIIIKTPEPEDIIIDVRHPHESEVIPLVVDKTPVIKLPFYKLESQIGTMDTSRRYLLFCDRGVISRLHAIHLYSEGYKNIGVYIPK